MKQKQMKKKENKTMLLSLKIKKVIESEIKVQQTLKKSLELQEANYGVDLSNMKNDIEKVIAYYQDFIKNGSK